MSLLHRHWLGGTLLAATTVITGSGNLPQAPQAQPTQQVQQGQPACPQGYFQSNGGCRPYSWSGANTTSIMQGPPEIPH